MLARTHIFVAATSLMALQAELTAAGYEFIQPHSVGGLELGPTLCGAAAILGGLLPDLDARRSKIQQRLGWLGRLLPRLPGIKHRGVLHSGLAALAITGLGLLIGRQLGYEEVGLALGVGYGSHVLLDALTVSGVPLFWPIRWRFHWLPRLFRFKTGSRMENVITATAAWLLLLSAFDITPVEVVHFIRQQVLNLG